MSPELLHVIAQIISRHTSQFGAIPLLRRWDPYERQHSDPLPFLFQHSTGQVRGVMSPTLIAKLIRTACKQVAVGRPQFDRVTFTPHDFRRLFATDLVNNGLPIHIGAAHRVASRDVDTSVGGSSGYRQACSQKVFPYCLKGDDSRI